MLEFSDRDLARFEAPLKVKPLGKHRANRRLIETCENYQPQMILLGHADLIDNQTLADIKQRHPDLRIAYRNVDPLFNPRTVANIQRRCEVVDSIFVTTGGDALKPFLRPGNRVCFMPNPATLRWKTRTIRQKKRFVGMCCFAALASRRPQGSASCGSKAGLTDLRFGVFGMRPTATLGMA